MLLSGWEPVVSMVLVLRLDVAGLCRYALSELLPVESPETRNVSSDNPVPTVMLPRVVGVGSTVVSLYVDGDALRSVEQAATPYQ